MTLASATTVLMPGNGESEICFSFACGLMSWTRWRMASTVCGVTSLATTGCSAGLLVAAGVAANATPQARENKRAGTTARRFIGGSSLLAMARRASYASHLRERCHGVGSESGRFSGYLRRCRDPSRTEESWRILSVSRCEIDVECPNHSGESRVRRPLCPVCREYPPDPLPRRSALGSHGAAEGWRKDRQCPAGSRERPYRRVV